MKQQFSEYMDTEAPIQMKVLFDELNDEQAIILEECFHAFARKVIHHLAIPVVDQLPDVGNRNLAFAILTKHHDFLQSNGEKLSEYVEDRIIDAMIEFSTPLTSQQFADELDRRWPGYLELERAFDNARSVVHFLGWLKSELLKQQ